MTLVYSFSILCMQPIATKDTTSIRDSAILEVQILMNKVQILNPPVWRGKFYNVFLSDDFFCWKYLLGDVPNFSRKQVLKYFGLLKPT